MIRLAGNSKVDHRRKRRFRMMRLLAKIRVRNSRVRFGLSNRYLTGGATCSILRSGWRII